MMLNIAPSKAEPPNRGHGFQFTNGPSATGPLAQEPRIDLLEIFRLVGRQIILIVGVVALFILSAFAYLTYTPTRYTASATLLIDPRQLVPLSASPSANSTIDSAYVDSAVEILKSDQIAKSVVNALSLETDPEFVHPPGLVGTVLQAIFGIFGASTEPSKSDLLGRASASLQSKLNIKRIGLTYVIQVDFQSRDPEKAARIANAVVEAYMSEQLESKYQSARQADSWLQQRISDLKTKAEAAEQAVAEFKSTTAQSTANPATLNDQQLAELAAKKRSALADLESSARISRNLYESLVQRSSEATQQQSMPIDPARVIARASAPLEPSHPKSVLILGAATLLGLFTGVAAAFAKERLNTVFRWPSQIERDLGIRCIGTMPLLPHHAEPTNAFRVGQLIDMHDNNDTKQQRGTGKERSGSGKNAALPVAERRVMTRDPYRHTFVVDQPFAALNETLRFIGAEFSNLGVQPKVIGISSAHPREGKSMVAVTLAELLADGGRRTLLIDCDLRTVGLTRQLSPSAKAGLGEALSGHAALNELLWSDAVTKLNFLPAVLPPIRVAHPAAQLSSAAMQNLLNSARESYDHVILDLPPILTVADTKAASPLVDSFIIVIEWGETRISAVNDALSVAPLVAENLLGAVLSKAKPGPLAHFHSRKLRELLRLAKARWK